MVHAPLPLAPRRFGETKRTDVWWLQPLIVFAVFSTFIAYSTWAALQGNHYTFGSYLSPFYSPELFGDSPNVWFGPRPGWWPSWMVFSPAILILWAPGGFRFTCYYYRGAYYKAFWADPPNCAVGEPRSSYIGERRFPLILQNVHRYFMYLAVIFLIILLPRCLERTVVHRCRRPSHVRRRRRYSDPRRQCHAAERLYPRLPLAASPGGWSARPRLGTPATSHHV